MQLLSARSLNRMALHTSVSASHVSRAIQILLVKLANHLQCIDNYFDNYYIHVYHKISSLQQRGGPSLFSIVCVQIVSRRTHSRRRTQKQSFADIVSKGGLISTLQHQKAGTMCCVLNHCCDRTTRIIKYSIHYYTTPLVALEGAPPINCLVATLVDFSSRCTLVLVVCKLEPLK